MKETLPQAIALCRVSTKGQLLDGNLEPQEERIIRAAAVLNVKIVQWWKLAVSSRKGKNLQRKDILEMYDYCKANHRVKYLIADEVDRFMRSISEYYYWKVMFQNIGVELRHANRPDADPTEDRAVFDELIDVYRAESSNNERIHKTPEKMMAKIRLGYYPSNPHSGYKKSDTPGLHVRDEPNWSAIRDTFKDMLVGASTVTEGLKLLHERGFRTKDYGPKSKGGKQIDMFRWKELMCDPYFCGVVRMKDWPVVNDNGLHEKMITKEEHRLLVDLAHNQGKRFIVNRNNPRFLLSNEVECQPCKDKGEPYPRIVGSNQNNGRKGAKRRYYERYWCRTCSKGITRQDLHEQVDGLINSMRITQEQTEQLKAHLAKLWSESEKVRINEMVTAERQLLQLKKKKNELVLNLDMKSNFRKDMEEAIDEVKKQISIIELTLAQSKDYDHDFNEFLSYSLDLIAGWTADFWNLDKDTMRRCKKVLFADGILLSESRNVYTTVKSSVYCLAKGKDVNVEVVNPEQLHPILAEVMRWRTVLGGDYSQYILSTFRASLVRAV